MRIYFSGGSGKTLPEGMIPDKRPHIMMTYFEVDKHVLSRRKAKDKPAPTNGPIPRIKAHLKNKSNEN